ncbi:MAG: GntR family transcriptional regulator [Clostridiales bacterium]|nr:GntR family transcriptional regulator [Clostridiales bacterium]
MVLVDNHAISLEEQIYMQLEEEILSGKLKTGEQLREQALSVRLGASRTPIRGALHRLAEAGLVEMNANRGVTVIGVSQNDLIETYSVRKSLEGLASKLASKNILEQDKNALKECIELAEFYINKKDAEKLREQDTAFHKIIYNASGNKVLCKILTDLHKKIKLYRKLSLSNPDRIEDSVKEHREILNAILSGDGDRADQLTALHIERAMNSIINLKSFANGQE